MLPVDTAQTCIDLKALRVLNQEVMACRLCPRLVQYRETIGRVQKRAYRGQEYWSRPLPGFGDSAARLLIVGLAPAAHGANRTGRMFTGDRSGEFLYRALWETGFANSPQSVSRDDGLLLRDAYITAPVRCAPPDNKPTREEILACRRYFIRELELLKNVRVVVVLGGIALDAYLSVLQDGGVIKSRAAFHFGHGARFESHPHGPLVLASYHPSQQNTSTKRLTAAMLREIFERARQLLEWPTHPEEVGVDSSATAGK
ncbi:MAG: uracil-DNA glycosylase [Bryobacteraceae bacterium]